MKCLLFVPSVVSMERPSQPNMFEGGDVAIKQLIFRVAITIYVSLLFLFIYLQWNICSSDACLLSREKLRKHKKLILEKNLSSRSKFPAILNLFRIKVSYSSFYACEIFVKEIIFLALTESR